MFNGKMKGLMIIHEHPGAMSTENKNIRRIFVKNHSSFRQKLNPRCHSQVQASQRFHEVSYCKDSCTATDSAVEGPCCRL
jgi:hypothetical protein